jgi:PAS domain S-box-containing protein
MTSLSSSAFEPLLWLEQAPLAIIVVDRHMRYVAASERWHQLYQLSVPDSATAIPLAKLWTHLPQHWLTVQQRVLQGTGEHSPPEWIHDAKGQGKWVQWEAQPWRDATGAIAGVMWSSWEVSPLAEGTAMNGQKDSAGMSLHKASANAPLWGLSHHEQRLAVALKLARLGTWEWDILTGDVIWSPETFAIYGLEVESTPMTFERQVSYVHPQDRQRFYTTLYETIYQETAYSFDFQIVHPDGTIRHLHAQGEPLFSEAGEVTHLFGVLLDISERKQIELQLRQDNADLTTLVNQYSEQLAEYMAEYQAIFESAGVGLQYIDRQGKIMRVNQSCCELLGYTEAELLQLSLPDLIHPEDFDRDWQLHQECVMGRRSAYTIEKRYVCKDGAVVWLSVSQSVVRDVNEQTRYLIAAMKDITSFKAVEADLRSQATMLENTVGALKKTQAQLVQTEKLSSLGQLMAGVAHEINNPVNFIYGNLSHASDYMNDVLGLLQLYQQYYPTPVEEILEEIETIDLDFLVTDLPQIFQSMQVGADRIKEIVASLRHFSRMDEAEMKPVNIHEGLDSTLMILRHRLKETSESPGINVVKNYGDLPLIECYAGQLNQVFMNILSNAIDALEERDRDRSADAIAQQPSEIVITTQASAERVCITLADNGPGIPEEVQSRLFDPFFTTKPVGKGTGLGLAISYQIITEKHNGQMRCHSQLDHGTMFEIQIPSTQPEPPAI